MHRGGGRRCLGWRASEVRTGDPGRGGAGREVAPAGHQATPAPAGSGAASRGPKHGSPAPPYTACAPEPLSASRRGTAFPPRLLPADSSLLFRLPAPICHSLPSPGQPAPPGYRGPTPPLGRNLSGLTARLGAFRVQLLGVRSCLLGLAAPPAIPPPGPWSVHAGRVAQRPLARSGGLRPMAAGSAPACRLT